MSDAGYVLSEEQFNRTGKTVTGWENFARNRQVLRPEQAASESKSLKFRNDSGFDIPPYGVMAVSGIYTPPSGPPFIKVMRPSSTFAIRYLVNNHLPVLKDGFGTAQEGPRYRIACDSTSAASGEGWGPKVDVFTLSKGQAATTIVDGMYDATNKVLLGTLSPIRSLIGKTTGAVTALTGSTAYKIYAGTMGSEADGGWTTVPSAVSRVAISSGKWIEIVPINNGWEMKPLECP